MADNSPNDVMKATADLLGAASDLVRAVSSGPPNSQPTALVPLNESLDSPAWYDLHHPQGSAGVHDLGEAYFDLYAPAMADPNNPGQLLWDPSKGATWKDFARIGRRLFDQAQVFTENNLFRPTPFSGLRLLQQMLGEYNVEQPDKVVSANFPWPTAPNFPNLDPAWTIRKAIAEYLSVFNIDPATGAVADRSLDFPNATGGALTLTHGQCVELRHVLVTQEDLRLVAPYDILGTLPW